MKIKHLQDMNYSLDRYHAACAIFGKELLHCMKLPITSLHSFYVSSTQLSSINDSNLCYVSSTQLSSIIDDIWEGFTIIYPTIINLPSVPVISCLSLDQTWRIRRYVALATAKLGATQVQYHYAL